MVLKLAFVLDLTFYYLSQFVICQKVHAYFSTRKRFFFLCRSSSLISFSRNFFSFEIYSLVKHLRFVPSHDLIWMEKTNRKLGIKRIAKLRILILKLLILYIVSETGTSKQNMLIIVFGKWRNKSHNKKIKHKKMTEMLKKEKNNWNAKKKIVPLRKRKLYRSK